MVYCTATGSQYQVYMKWCLPRFVLDTDTLADLTFRCEGYSDSLLGEAR